MAVAVVERLFWQLGTCSGGSCRCREVILAVGDMQWWQLPLYRGCFGSWGHAVVAVAVVERFKLE